MSPDVSILLHRVGVILLLFLFLAQALLLMRGDLRAAAGRHVERGGRLKVMESGASKLSKGDVLPLLGVNSLGRNPGNSHPIIDDSVSVEHLILSYDGAAWRVEDLGTTNGTYLNGQRIEKAALAYGDILQVGRTKLKLERARLD